MTRRRGHRPGAGQHGRARPRHRGPPRPRAHSSCPLGPAAPVSGLVSSHGRGRPACRALAPMSAACRPPPSSGRPALGSPGQPLLCAHQAKTWPLLLKGRRTRRCRGLAARGAWVSVRRAAPPPSARPLRGADLRCLLASSLAAAGRRRPRSLGWAAVRWGTGLSFHSALKHLDLRSHVWPVATAWDKADPGGATENAAGR